MKRTVVFGRFKGCGLEDCWKCVKCICAMYLDCAQTAGLFWVMSVMVFLCWTIRYGPSNLVEGVELL